MIDKKVSFGRIVLLLGVVVATIGFVTVATGSPQPSPLCDVCGEEFEQRAAHEGYSISVDESRLRIEFAPDGTSQWTIYNRLDSPLSEQFPTD
jgi:hypothetical protein